MVWSRAHAAAGPAVFIVPAYATIVLISLGLFFGHLLRSWARPLKAERPAAFGSSYQKAGWSTTPTTEDPADAR